ncbi:MAG: cupin domain-containing protein [Sedimenticola sp.]|nr:cupin domain-containing protein [Sedimenticola sp.]
MFSLELSGLTPQQFLATYWQKKPTVIRQGFKDFQDPITADELAGLACDETVESRLVYKKAGEWQAEFGPFESYEHLGEREWTLVVQAVDHWLPQVAALAEPFNFIPSWRKDDLMMSFSAPGGGVGPHIDLYDVFIIQGTGKRQWRVGERGAHSEFAAHEALLHVEDFEPIIDVVLLPGDILYIPPGFPHDGKALEAALSYSVGFRTNSGYELIEGLADYLGEHCLAKDLMTDAGRLMTLRPGEISAQDYDLIKQHLLKMINDDELFSRFTGEFLSQAKHELDIAPQDDEGYSREEVIGLLQQGTMLHRLGGLRCLYLASGLSQGRFYIDGDEKRLPSEMKAVIQLLCDHSSVSAELLLPWIEQEAFLEFLIEQLNAGYWYFDGA